MINSNSICIKLIIITILLLKFSNQLENKINNPPTLEKKQIFYEKILRLNPSNENITISNQNGELYLSTKNAVKKYSNLLTLSHKHLFTGCILIKFYLKIFIL